MKKKLMIASLSLSLGLNGFTYSVSAETLNSIKQKQEQNKKQQTQKESEMHNNHEEQDETLSKIDTIAADLKKTGDKIQEKESDISSTKAVISDLKEEIAVLEKRIAERDKLLKERVKSMYENGGAVSYLSVVLGSSSFGDFIDRMISLNLIASQDQAILEEHRSDKENVAKKKTQVETELQNLTAALSELQGLKNQLDAQKKEQNRLLASLKEEEQHIHEDLMDIEEKNAILTAQEAAIKAEIQRAKQEAERKKREEAARKAAAEEAARAAAQKAAAAAAQAKKSPSAPAAAPAPAPAPEPAPVVSSRDFAFPTSGYITSRFGNREGGMHYGADIAKPGDGVAVTAAAGGTVARSYYSSSYGNCVLITHYVNGQIYTTVYAHMRNRAVSEGQSVSQGQYLGDQGNTGNSFGQHLHFEMHKGGWNAAKSNAVDPLPYIQ